jgi:hypothetical protein
MRLLSLAHGADYVSDPVNRPLTAAHLFKAARCIVHYVTNFPLPLLSPFSFSCFH